ncbi:hypothetical protein BX070DRAFT_221059 [Coemansia spiralis]|nr:hypothetical protein BX070DRAFT_221059 [Coemansia spiralis]
MNQNGSNMPTDHYYIDHQVSPISTNTGIYSHDSMTAAPRSEVYYYSYSSSTFENTRSDGGFWIPHMEATQQFDMPNQYYPPSSPHYHNYYHQHQPNIHRYTYPPLLSTHEHTSYTTGVVSAESSIYTEQRRVRCAQACKYCHRRKARCVRNYMPDGSVKCDNCMRDGVECEWRESKRRGPKRRRATIQNNSSEEPVTIAGGQANSAAALSNILNGPPEQLVSSDQFLP